MSSCSTTTGTIRPLIGVTGRRFRLGLVDGMDQRYGHLFADAFMSDFSDRIARAGGIPVDLPYDADPEALCHWLSGVVITGGQDVHPACWGGDLSVVRDVNPRDNPMVHDATRDEYEIALVRAALARGIPVLGVCRGLQILNVALGGTLIADLPHGSVEHLSGSAAPFDGADDHKVTFVPGSLAERLFGAGAVTNSWHHQAVDSCGTGLVVTGRAGDGVVESVELPGAAVLGVQWHPEWMERDDPALSWIVIEGNRRIGSCVPPHDHEAERDNLHG
ncbi:gamma-glutamyl-gamma-aminobutyrate hydrolase family protein [Arthrobacter sp. CDRTa11]|uniref:gamma-glutamyl-gamma-aminobutyrate hydrolase family protein n=1 Tax=Arthrobacter sp. CDRTa11 TaxID=2651199 RepID=UPI002265EE37|nr:gamma-glutamyl-gamma-aminobutyrate hydrolase family protein [Arthrobacter sp. CDRTa11]UZX04723.1 gamma-glutamyl-gamma-aminobutyrate hydrolase family protein [Arthrobacter sp. CDRTa11]